jgi:hypothetical protein
LNSVKDLKDKLKFMKITPGGTEDELKEISEEAGR